MHLTDGTGEDQLEHSHLIQVHHLINPQASDLNVRQGPSINVGSI